MRRSRRSGTSSSLDGVAGREPGEEPATTIDAALLEESVEDLYEHAPVGYLSTLPSGLAVKANETLLSLTGYRREDLVGRKRLHDLLAPGARIYYETHYAPLLQMQGTVQEIAVELVRADGSRIPVLLNSTLVRDEFGEPRVIRTTIFDASHRRRYERELQRLRADAETRALAALALEHVHDGVMLVTRDGGIDVLNPAAERILGVAAAETVGRQVAEVVPEWEGVAAETPLGRAVVVPITRGGHEQWLSVAGVDAGEGGVVWSMRDVTADHTVEQLRGDVVAIVSHELRTPLTGVYGSAQTLLARYDELGDDVRRQLLTILVEQTERLTRLVDRILLTGNLDHGELAVTAEPCGAAEVVATAVQALGDVERARVRVDAEPEALVLADADLAHQVLVNLLDNALKYSDGAVSITVEPGDGTVRFTVADDGPGIPPGERDRVFEKFYRLDPDQRRGVGGAGLGLYVARELAQRLGGRISLLPTAEGTSVAVDLPGVESRA